MKKLVGFGPRTFIYVYNVYIRFIEKPYTKPYVPLIADSS